MNFIIQILNEYIYISKKLSYRRLKLHMKPSCVLFIISNIYNLSFQNRISVTDEMCLVSILHYILLVHNSIMFIPQFKIKCTMR